MEDRYTFDPGQHLSKVKGQDYLEVKWRLVWFRDRFPAGKIETSIHHISNEIAIIHATATAIGDGGELLGLGSGIGTCTAEEFGDYVEKAETKAIGRALATLGFGTQFAPEFNEDGRVADAPVGARSQGGGDNLATNAQKSMIQYKARQANLEPERLVAFIQEMTGKTFNELTKRDASQVIDALSAQPGPQAMRRGGPQ